MVNDQGCFLDVLNLSAKSNQLLFVKYNMSIMVDNWSSKKDAKNFGGNSKKNDKKINRTCVFLAHTINLRTNTNIWLKCEVTHMTQGYTGISLSCSTKMYFQLKELSSCIFPCIISFNFGKHSYHMMMETWRMDYDLIIAVFFYFFVTFNNNKMLN